VRDKAGSLTTNALDDPHGQGTTTINGVNDAGDLVGFCTDSAGNTDGMLALPAADQALPQPAAVSLPPRGSHPKPGGHPGPRLPACPAGTHRDPFG
jgi:hypothetical protein